MCRETEHSNLFLSRNAHLSEIGFTARSGNPTCSRSGKTLSSATARSNPASLSRSSDKALSALIKQLAVPLLFNATAVETQIKLRPNTGSFRRPIKDWYLGTIELFPVCPRWTAWTLDILTGNGNWWFWAEQDTRVKNSSDIRFASDSQTHGVYYSRAFLGKFPLSNWVADMTGMQRKDHSVGCSFPSHRRCFLRREAQTWWACVFGRIRLCLGVPGKIKETEREREGVKSAAYRTTSVECVCVWPRSLCVCCWVCLCTHANMCDYFRQQDFVWDDSVSQEV